VPPVWQIAPDNVHLVSGCRLHGTKTALRCVLASRYAGRLIADAEIRISAVNRLSDVPGVGGLALCWEGRRGRPRYARQPTIEGRRSIQLSYGRSRSIDPKPFTLRADAVLAG
jgi:hypothetical protein